MKVNKNNKKSKNKSKKLTVKDLKKLKGGLTETTRRRVGVVYDTKGYAKIPVKF